MRSRAIDLDGAAPGEFRLGERLGSYSGNDRLPGASAPRSLSPDRQRTLRQRRARTATCRLRYSPAAASTGSAQRPRTHPSRGVRLVPVRADLLGHRVRIRSGRHEGKRLALPRASRSKGSAGSRATRGRASTGRFGASAATTSPPTPSACSSCSRSRASRLPRPSVGEPDPTCRRRASLWRLRAASPAGSPRRALPVPGRGRDAVA